MLLTDNVLYAITVMFQAKGSLLLIDQSIPLVVD